MPRHMMKDALDFAVLAILYFLVFYRRWKARGKDVLFVNTVMYIYLTFVLYFTLMPVIASMPFVFRHSYRSMNLVPFIDVTLGRGDFARQILLNIVMTMPFGFLLPLVKPGRMNLAKVILLTFLLSFGIEIMQLLLSNFRSSDITDIITNVTGGVVGYGFYLIFRPLVNSLMDKMRKLPEGDTSGKG